MFQNVNKKLFRGLSLAIVLAMVFATFAWASDVDVAVVDVTVPTNSVILAPGASAPITINMSVTGNQAGTATFEVYRDWTLTGGIFAGSNPQEFTVNPRSPSDPASTFSTSGTVTVAAGQATGTFTLAVGAFDITNSNTTGAKLAAGDPSNYQVTVQTPPPPSDTTPPIITPHVSGSHGNNGWYVSDVTVSWTVSDPESAISSTSGCDATTIDTDIAGTTITCTATSAGGTSSESVTIKRDATPPIAACGSADGQWHGMDVSIACTASDDGSGLASADDANFSLTTNVPEDNETDNASTDSHDVYDEAGNFTTAGPIPGNKVDKKAPSVSCGSADGQWHASDVSIACTASDGGSGLDDEGDANFLLSTNVPADTEDNDASTNSHAVQDAVGNTSVAGPISGNMVDKKAPTVACGSADGLWHANDVSIACTANDDGSGLADPADASFSLSTSVPVGTEDSNASTNSRSVADAVGNSTTAGPISGNKVDKKSPTLTCQSPAPTFVLNQSGATVSATVTDGGSGPAESPISAAAPTNAVGSHSIPLTGYDNVSNATSVNCSYNVAYDFAGFFSPVDNLMPNGAKAGQAIPIKWRLTDYYGNPISDPSSFVNVSSSGSSAACGGTADEIETYAGSSGLQYLGDGFWQFNWKTPKTYAGQCRTMSLNLFDGTHHTANFIFK